MGWIADLLKEIPTAARYKAELEQLESERDTLKTENENLQSKLQAAEEKVRNLEKELRGDGGQLPEIHEKLMQMLAQGALHEDDLAKRMGMGREAVRFHAEELLEAKMVDGQTFFGQPILWRLEQPGRKYLMKRGLLK
ncbi:MAG: hypothetical protein ACT4P8_06810 [Betaproteobacteria bacterium]